MKVALPAAALFPDRLFADDLPDAVVDRHDFLLVEQLRERLGGAALPLGEQGAELLVAPLGEQREEQVKALGLPAALTLPVGEQVSVARERAGATFAQ